VLQPAEVWGVPFAKEDQGLGNSDCQAPQTQTQSTVSTAWGMLCRIFAPRPGSRVERWGIGRIEFSKLYHLSQKIPMLLDKCKHVSTTMMVPSYFHCHRTPFVRPETSRAAFPHEAASGHGRETDDHGGCSESKEWQSAG
jgi:hypothetical protein